MTPAHALRNAIEEWEQSSLLRLPHSSLTFDRDKPIGAGSEKLVFKGVLQVGGPQPITCAVLKMRNHACETEVPYISLVEKFMNHMITITMTVITPTYLQLQLEFYWMFVSNA